MTLTELMEKSREMVVNESIEEMNRARLKHYAMGGPEITKQKMETLYDLVYQSVKAKNLIPIVTYIEKIAGQRFESGFELQEVQTAINVLEESIWRRILEEIPKDEQPKALTLVSSIIGSGKDTLARTWVTLTKVDNNEENSKSGGQNND